jgi:hypothetical protein
VQTPQGETNPPGLPAIAYRTGTWATFKDSMLARLSSSDYPALSGLLTRSDDDFSIALLDASAVVLDILTFYQERWANESYLRTATQLYSLTQLGQLIGYQPSPGVSASTYLAFTLAAATGLPTNPGTTAITIPAGTTVQSVPAQGQTPQSFQTSADIFAKADWNALPVQTGVPWSPAEGVSGVYLQGTATQLNPGDAFLIVDGGVPEDPAAVSWYVGIVTSAQADTTNQRTLVSWTQQLGGSAISPTFTNAAFYALRQRAALFGYNAINPLMMTPKARAGFGGYISGDDWTFGQTSGNWAAYGSMDLDGAYPKLVPGGWSFVSNNSQGSTSSNLAYIQAVDTATRADYGISGKITRLTVSLSNGGSGLSDYYGATRSVAVLAQSELLPAAEQPLDHPLYGPLLELETVRPDLAGVTAVAVIGKSQKITVAPGFQMHFHPDDRNPKVLLKAGDTLTLIQPPTHALNQDGTIPSWTGYSAEHKLYVADSSGRSGTVTAALSSFTLAPAVASDPTVQEFALVSSISVDSDPYARTCLKLQNPLVNCYDRTMTTVNANVGMATAGSPVTELLGSGSAATPNQAFTLKQSPLTYVQAVTPSGSQSSLQVTVNGAAWTQVPTLYGQKSSAQVYATTNLTGGTAVVQFGDGVEGSTVPTGQSNVIANYRVGIGSAGNVGIGTITTLVDRPVGVTGVNNPMPATGGQDAQSAGDVRANAPQSVLTLGRAVSITDYQNFAATFAGIAKAQAVWIPNGLYRGVFLTVAGANGAALPPGNPTLANLVTALHDFGTPNIRINAQSFYETLFGLTAKIAYDPAYNASSVQTQVMAELTATYSFATRSFGQGVSGDEIAALIQGVPGVVAVNVTQVKAGDTSSAGNLGNAAFSLSAYNTWLAQRKSVTRKSAGPTRICPYVQVAAVNAVPIPAEILVLDPDPSKVVLEVMT